VTPLSKRPPTGKTLAFAACNIPACLQYVPGTKAATEALGWKFLEIPYTSGNPNPAVQQAVNANANYIIISGESSALYKSALASAHAKGIKVISAVDISPVARKAGLIAQISGASGYNNQLLDITNWVINRSRGKAHIVLVNAPGFPILAAAYGAMKANVSKYCSSCTIDQLGVALPDLVSGKVPGELVSYLQTHPDVNNVVFSFADPLVGVAQVLKSSGLSSRVLVTGVQATPVSLGGIISGSFPAWDVADTGAFGWTQVDAAARDSVGDPQLPTSQSDQQQWVVTTPARAAQLKQTGNLWQGPPGYQQQFKKLWKITP
jgi:ABC-type sugar transport system substrate-binding protein